MLCLGLLAAIPAGRAQETAAHAQAAVIEVVDADVGLFWRVYDRVRAEPDRAQQVALLQREYFQRASPGLAAFREAKGYDADAYVDAINRWPAYWDTVRPRTRGIAVVTDKLVPLLRRFRELYPAARPAAVYFEVGALRSAGTTLGDKVLIGAEMAAGDSGVDVSQMPDGLQRFFRSYFASRPAQNLDLLIVHELVHTQQRGERGSLLAQAVYEGVADFVAEQVTGRLPDLDYVRYGPRHDAAIKAAFRRDMHAAAYDGWLYDDGDNPFATRDLGYYVGYAICSRNFARATDKPAALARMIELDYADPRAVAGFVADSGYFGD